MDRELKIGDLTIVSDGKLGFTIKTLSGEEVWFNKKGAIALHKWLGDRWPDDLVDSDAITAATHKGEVDLCLKIEAAINGPTLTVVPDDPE